jgi:hypothetical protein
MSRYFIAITATFILIFSPVQMSYAMGLYSKPVFRGRVLDAETKKPIEGAVVVVLYDKRPLIGGPGGPNSYTFHAKETLTHDKGEFLIPAYKSVLIFTKDAGISFIIFKPGYMASYGPPYIDTNIIEKYFSSDVIGKEEEIVGGYGTPTRYNGPLGIVELEKAKTFEERSKGTPDRPTGYTSKDLPLLFKAVNEDRKERGLEGEIR